MSAEIINLNKARKTQAKIAAKAAATVNRAKFGRTSTQKAKDAAEASRLRRTLDAARRSEDDA